MFNEKLWNKTTKIFDKANATDLDSISSIFARFVLNIRDDGAIVFTTENDFGKNYIFSIVEKDGGVVGQVIDDDTGEILQEWELTAPKLIYHNEVTNG